MHQFSSEQCHQSNERWYSWKRRVVFNSAQVYPQSIDLNQIQFIIATFTYKLCYENHAQFSELISG